MEALHSTFEYPYLFIVAFLLGLPIFYLLAQSFFSDPEDDLEADLQNQAWNALTDSNYSVIVWKFIGMLAVGGAFITAFYKGMAWVASFL